MDAKDIENNLKGVPPLTTLRQGIVVLSRQWKNALYTPILIEYNLRSRGLKNLYSAQVEFKDLCGTVVLLFWISQQLSSMGI